MPQLHKLKCKAYNIPKNTPAIDVQEGILKEKMLGYISTIIKYAGKSKKKAKRLVGKAKERLRHEI